MATTFGCHFEGNIPYAKVIKFIKRVYDIGIRSFNLCDTVGMAHPNSIKEIVKGLLSSYPDCEFHHIFMILEIWGL